MRIAKTITLLLLISICSVAFGSKLAVVKEPKMVVYADEDLMAPIGTLSQGTQIKIGEKFRKGGMVAYTTYENRIVYLKVSDISISGIKDEFILNNTRFKLQALEEKKKLGLPSLAYISFKIGQSIPGTEWADLAKQMETKNSLFYFIGMQAEYNYKQGPFTAYVGYEYSTNFDNQLNIQMYTLDLGMSYGIFQGRHYSFDLLGGPILSPGIGIYTENKQYFTRGSGYGYKLGASLKLFRQSKWGITLGANYRYQTLTGHEDIQLPGDYYRPTKLDTLTEYRTVVMINRRISL